MLNFKLKRNRTNTWELKARDKARYAASYTSDVDSFVRAFKAELETIKMDSSQHISSSYRAIKVDQNTAHVVWNGHTKAGDKDIVIAEVTNKI